MCFLKLAQKLADFLYMTSFLCPCSPCKISQTGVFEQFWTDLGRVRSGLVWSARVWATCQEACAHIQVMANTCPMYRQDLLNIWPKYGPGMLMSKILPSGIQCLRGESGTKCPLGQNVAGTKCFPTICVILKRQFLDGINLSGKTIEIPPHM